MFKKHIIALCLFFSYSLGMAHACIPHCHHDDANERLEGKHQHVHQHHSHENGAGLDEEHHHFSHADHLDGGFFDFIVCLLTETEHPDTDQADCLFLPSERTDRNLNKLEGKDTFRNHAAEQDIIRPMLNVRIDLHPFPGWILVPFSETWSNRGPPKSI